MTRDEYEAAVFAKASEGDRYPRGNSRAPVFGERVRGIWASESNPQRDGFFVKTVRTRGRVNRGEYYELTDGAGSFWRYERSQTVFLEPVPQKEKNWTAFPRAKR